MAVSVGLIVNPIAGMGGKVGLKGTDGEAILERARMLGAEPLANERTGIALVAAAWTHGAPELFTVAGDMGENVAQAAGLDPHIVGQSRAGASDAGDTAAAAQAMLGRGVDLILFAGGDGTARDIFQIAGQQIPLLGIPTGVKMHSAVFATGPASAGRLAAEFLSDGSDRIRLADAEIMDIDEEEQRRNRLSARLFGYARVPYERRLIQHAKAASTTSGAGELNALTREIAEQMASGMLHIIGPGSTTQNLLKHMGLEGTLLGADVVLDGDLVVKDASEADLLAVLDGRSARIITGVIGGQGFLLGRGNQQISAKVIQRVGVDNIMVVAAAEKLIALDTSRLLVDTGDRDLDAELSGFIRVHTGPGQTMMLRVSAA